MDPATPASRPMSTSATVNVFLQDDQEPQLADQILTAIPEFVPGERFLSRNHRHHRRGPHPRQLQPFTYSILSGNDNTVNGQTGAFAIDSNGVVTVANHFGGTRISKLSPFTLKILVVDSHLNPQLGDTATITINLTNANEAPVLSAIEGTPLAYVEKNTTPVTSTLIATDPDSTSLIIGNEIQGATVQITGNSPEWRRHTGLPRTRRIFREFLMLPPER